MRRTWIFPALAMATALLAGCTDLFLDFRRPGPGDGGDASLIADVQDAGDDGSFDALAEGAPSEASDDASEDATEDADDAPEPAPDAPSDAPSDATPTPCSDDTQCFG